MKGTIFRLLSEFTSEKSLILERHAYTEELTQDALVKRNCTRMLSLRGSVPE